jgi:hypothetical protein
MFLSLRLRRLKVMYGDRRTIEHTSIIRICRRTRDPIRTTDYFLVAVDPCPQNAVNHFKPHGNALVQWRLMRHDNRTMGIKR